MIRKTHPLHSALVAVLAAFLAFAPTSNTYAAPTDRPSVSRGASPAPVPPDDAPFEDPGRPAVGPVSRTLHQPDTVTASDLPAVGGAWVSQGPGPITGGQVEGMTPTEVVGAIESIVPHPTNAAVIWVGSVNGGVWKTTNATSTTPAWTNQTDSFASLSIGDLELDPTDGSHNTLVAGTGRMSSFSGIGGPRGVMLRTADGGTTWTALTATGLAGKNIFGVVPRGATIVVSVNIADVYSCGNLGIFRSTDTGATFTRLSGNGASGLPEGGALDLAGDPTNSAVMYVALDDTNGCSGGATANGIYKSTDTGATWTRVSNAAMDTLMADDGVLNNTQIVVGAAGQVFVGIINNGRLAGLFRSGNGGAAWTQLDTPSTNEGGTSYGLQPRIKPGGQGGIHFSIAADPVDSNIVYVGGDRQPGSGDAGGSFPNSIGANNYTGRLFRVNAGLAAGSQSTPLTHCAVANAACNNTTSTTANGAPHADSRHMAFDANGNLLEGDDGGIYRRTNPRTTGDWFSVNGTLRVGEVHNLGYDTVSNMIVGGLQDNGSAEQQAVNGISWSTINQGDGGDVAIDDRSSTTQSRRYTSAQNLGGFNRRVMDAAGAVTASEFPALTVNSGGPAFGKQFVTPVEVNSIDGSRILFAGSNDLYESLDRGDTITALGFNQASHSMVYGGKIGGVDTAAVIWALCISTQALPCTTTDVYARTSGTGKPVKTAGSPGTAPLRDITADPADSTKAYVINTIGKVYATADTGATWTEVTGNLGDGSTDLRTITFIPGTPSSIVVGGLNGVFRMAATSVGVWNRLGTGLTNALVHDLDYDSLDDVLVASTMGRGVWKLASASAASAPVAAPTNVVATATGETSVNVTWTAAVGAASYRVYRSANGTTYTQVPGSPTGTTFDDTTAVANTAYLYKVRSFAGTESGDSNVDLATTVVFTDATLNVATTPIKAVHFTEAMTAVNAVRTLAGQAGIAFTAPAPAAGGTVLAQHLLDLRGGLNAARATLTLLAVSYAEGAITAGTTTVKTTQMNEIRNGVR